MRSLKVRWQLAVAVQYAPAYGYTSCIPRNPASIIESSVGVRVPPISLAMVFTPSLGDIATAANISCSIYKALSDSTGSSYEYQCLIEELRSFERALIMVDCAMAQTPPGGHLTQTIANETTTCLALLNAFLDNIKSYQKALGGERKGAASWRKIGWGLLKADDVARFREKLLQHKQNINIFLTSLAM